MIKDVEEKYESLLNRYKEEYSRIRKEWYNNLSKEDKEKRIQQIKDQCINMNESVLHEISLRVKKWKNYYNQLSDEEQKEFVKKSMYKKKFESYFLESYISNNYYIKDEILLTNVTTHKWDYGIYDKLTNELVMVVDLDELNSKEEYDERILLSIPDGIKVSIINEMKFKNSFENMIKTLMIDYDAFVEYQFNICRSMPFPYPKYTDMELIRSYNQLCKMKTDNKYHKDISLRNREGDRLISHFHESIYMAKRKETISPYEAWYNDDLLRKVIKNRIIYVNTINPNKILQGFNISKVATKISIFSAGRAKILISRYLNEYDEIFDPFSGFSGRMLGSISSNKQYIGQDISPIHVNESNNMLLFLKDNGIQFNANIECKDILQSSGEYECLFTCPPYSDIEQWYEVPVDKRTCDDWITECINRFKCKKYLFVVNETNVYKDYIINEISNKSHFSKNKEYVIMICRE